MMISEKLLVLWVISLVIWIISVILEYITAKKKIKAEEQHTVSIYYLYQEVKRLNTRIDSYYHIKATESMVEDDGK